MARKKNKYFDEYRRYVITAVMFIGVFMVSFMFYEVYRDYNDKLSNTSYLEKKNIVKTYKIEEDLTDIKNLEKDYFLYISYTGNKEIYELEKDINSIIKEYKLKDKFYYINIDSIKDDENKIQVINEFLGFNEFKIEKVPTIVYVDKNGELKRSNIITRLDDNLIEKGDFQQLLDINEYK